MTPMKSPKLFISIFIMSSVLGLVLLATGTSPTIAQGPDGGFQPNFPPPPTPTLDLSKTLEGQSSPPVSGLSTVIDVPLDILIVQDETGSMSDDVGSLKSLAPAIWDSIGDMAQAGFRMGVVGFRDYARSPWGDSGDWVYQLRQNFTTSRDEFVAGVNALSASGGNDTPESQYPALYYMLTPSHLCIDSNGDGDCLDSNDTPVGQQPSFRVGAKRVILLATDAPFHDPLDTSGYPGPNRDAVVDALRASNATVIGLVPGGAGRIPEVDDLATATGGSVQDTGSSGQGVADAVAEAVGAFHSVPGTGGSLWLTAPSFFLTSQSIIPSVQVGNDTDTSNTYAIVVSLIQSGITLQSISQNVTVPEDGSVTISGINFGMRSIGEYQLRAELRLGGSLLSTKQTNVVVLDPAAQHLAEVKAGLLKEAAQDEFYEMSELSAKATAESIADAGGLGLDFLMDYVIKHLIEFLNPILDAAGLSHGLGGSVVGRIEEQFTEIYRVGPSTSTLIRQYALSVYAVEIPADFDPLNPVFDSIADAIVKDRIQKALVGFLKDALRPMYQRQWTAPQMDRVTARDKEFAASIASHPFSWDGQFDRIFQDGQECISNIVEADPVKSFGGTDITLSWQEQQRQNLRRMRDQLEFVAKILTILIILVGTVLVILALVSTAGLSAPAIAAVAIKFLAIVKKLSMGAKIVIFLGTAFLTIGMMVTVSQIAPHVTDEHDNTLDAIEEIVGTTGRILTLGDLRAEAVASGRSVVLDTSIKNAETGRTVSPLATNVVYSADGRAVACRWTKLNLAAGEVVPLTEEFTLPEGSYKSVAALRSAEQPIIDVGARTFALGAPNLRLTLSLDKSKFVPGEAVHAFVDLTNMEPVDRVDDLILIIESTDGEHFDNWLISLEPGASQHMEYAFVPQTTGSYVVRASLLAELGLIAQQNAAYVVGDGPALALNTAVDEVYQPNLSITLPMTVTNSGTVPTTAIVSWIIVDRLTDFTPIYTDSLALSVDTDSSVAFTAVALPVSLANPGQYTLWVYLGGAPYANYDFAIAALDTIFVSVYPNAVSQSVGAVVPLNVEVTNSTYAYTDAEASAVLWRPDGTTETISLDRVDVGRYQGEVTPLISGTYLVDVTLNSPGYRVYPGTTFFVADQRSRLLPTVDGRAVLGTVRPITVTIRNEWGTPLIGARVVISNTGEYFSEQTDELGQIVFQLSPVVSASYQVTLEKPGFDQTMMDIPVWVAPDVTPPALFLNVPSITNNAPLQVTGLAEAGAIVNINGRGIAVDARGRFTTTVALSEGDNLLTATATDSTGNTATLAQTVILDTVPPALFVAYPPLGLHTELEVITATGSTEPGANVTVNDIPIVVDPTTGAFSAWVLLRSGGNSVSVVATDAAENSTTVTRLINAVPLYLPLVMKDSRGFPPPGFDSQFNGSAPGWEAHSGLWVLDTNYYSTAGIPNAFSSASYAMNFANVDYQARLRRSGCDTCANNLIIRGTPTPLGTYNYWYNWYVFQYTRIGGYSVWKGVAGSEPTALQNWATSSAINQGDAWNTLRVVANGANLYFYINGTLVWSGSDSSLASGRVGLSMFRTDTSTGDQLLVDWATLTTLSAAGMDALGTVSPEQQALNDEANQHGGGSVNVAPERP
jgi:hypothetical protein